MLVIAVFLKFENRLPVKIAVQAIPNPAHDNVTLFITSAKPKLFKANIFNDKGQQIKNITITPEEITSGKKVDISSFAEGTYFISLIDGWEIVASAKFIKQ